jgi:hypothetical protein
MSAALFSSLFGVTYACRMTNTVKFAFAWVQENAEDFSCISSLTEFTRQYHERKKKRNFAEVDESSLISEQLLTVLDALARAVQYTMRLVPTPSFNVNESHCAAMAHSDQLDSNSVACLLVELPMAIFERDTSCSNSKCIVPRLRHSLVPRCDLTTAAGRFMTSMIVTLFLLHQRVMIDLPDLDDALNRIRGSSNIVVLSSIGGSTEDFLINNPNLLFPLNLQESAMQHSVEGLLFYTHGHYVPPPTHLMPLKLLNVFEWNCLEYSPFARDPDSFCRSLIAGEIGKRGLSVYNIDPDSVFLRDINRTAGHFGHLSMANYYFTYEELWLNFSMHVGRMNNFGQWYLQSRSPFSVPWSFFIHLLATDLSTTSNGPDTPVDDILKRYRISKTKADRADFSFLGDNTQCGDDQHVFNDFFAFFSQDKSARFVRRVHRRAETIFSKTPLAFLDFRILTGQETAMAVSYCRGTVFNDTTTVHLTTYGDRQHKPTCLKERGTWYLDMLAGDLSWFKGQFISFDDVWFEALVTRFQEGEASQVP